MSGNQEQELVAGNVVKVKDTTTPVCPYCYKQCGDTCPSFEQHSPASGIASFYARYKVQKTPGVRSRANP